MQSTEEAKNPEAQLIKGMRQLDKKNIIQDLQSKKKSWEDIGVPEEIIFSLEDLKMDKPSSLGLEKEGCNMGKGMDVAKYFIVQKTSSWLFAFI